IGAGGRGRGNRADRECGEQSRAEKETSMTHDHPPPYGHWPTAMRTALRRWPATAVSLDVSECRSVRAGDPPRDGIAHAVRQRDREHERRKALMVAPAMDRSALSADHRSGLRS